MTKLYYSLWADAFIKIRWNSLTSDLWKLNSLVIISTTMAFNLGLIVALLKKYLIHSDFYYLNLSFIQDDFLVFSINGLLLFFLPFMMLNYLLVFRNNKYIRFEKESKTYNGKLFKNYILISSFGSILLMLLIQFIENIVHDFFIT